MERDKLKTIYGQLDSANECIKRVSEILQEAWSSGESRMKGGDIKRAEKYLTSIIVGSRNSKIFTNLFKGIAPTKQDDTK